MPQPFETLSCDQACGRIEALIDGDLDQKASEDVRRHIEDCPSCRNELELAEEVRATLRSLPSFAMPVGVLHAVRTATVADSEQEPAAGWWTRPVAALAAIAAAVLLALVIAPERQKPLPHTDSAEVERVTAETRVAMAYLASAARRAEARLTQRVVRDRAVMATVKGVSSSLKWAYGSDTSTPKNIGNEGSL